MSRNLVICCDGTNNQYSETNTSVVRIVQALDLDPAKQLFFYDPGVGTMPEARFTSRVGKRLSEVSGLAFGTGLIDDVQQAYRYLMEHWQPDDRVFIFGFSRGAYTARALASLLWMFGLLPAGADNQLPYVMRQFRASRQKLDKSTQSNNEYWNFVNGYRETFARELVPGAARNFPVHFAGVWDTVSSVGYVYSPDNFPFTARNPGIGIARHAMAIDERRCFFRQNRFLPLTPPASQDLKQLWFAGVHSDVGGGYPESQSGLWRVAFEWMLDEAQLAGLLVDKARKNVVLNRTVPAAKPWAEPQHESLTAGWWPVEFFPKLRRKPGTFKKQLRMGRGRRRTPQTGEHVHPSVILRVRDRHDYNPPNLPATLLARWRGGNNDTEIKP